MYFATNGFLPVYLGSIGRSELIASALTALNVGQIPASFLLLIVADRLVRRKWPYLFAGIGALASIGVLVATSGSSIIVAAAVLGFCCGAVLTLALAVAPLLCAPQDVARTAAAIFTLSYGWAVLVPILSGEAWDLSGIPGFAFLPVALCALMLIALASRIDLHHAT
jgi:CP family cyanate transporter-like MFS transporter